MKCRLAEPNWRCSRCLSKQIIKVELNFALEAKTFLEANFGGHQVALWSLSSHFVAKRFVAANISPFVSISISTDKNYIKFIQAMWSGGVGL